MKINEANAKNIEMKKAVVTTLVEALNKAIKDNEPIETVNKKKADVEDEMKKLNDAEQAATFAAFRAEKSPMLKAIEELTYELSSLKAINDKKTHKTTSYEINKKTVRINPADLEDFCSNLIGVTVGWRYLAEDFSRFLAARKAKEIGADWKAVCETYKLHKQTERTDIKEPTSMNNLIERLQALVDAMYFAPYVNKEGKEDVTKNQYKITSKDVGFVLGRAYPESRKLLTVGTLKRPMGSMLLIAMEVLNHLVFGNEYNIEYKAM